MPSATDPWAALRHAQHLVQTGQRRRALELAQALAALPSKRADWNDALGAILTHCEDPSAAITFFKAAVSSTPAHPGYQYNLATAQRMIGDFEGAEESLNRVIALNPGDMRAYYTRADLRVQSTERNHVQQLSALLENPLPVAQEILLRFALGKELEDLGRYDEAFANFRRGCELERSRIHYSVAEDVATLREIMNRHDRGALQNHSDLASEECIFVIGLPRTGTTLIERILGRHSRVVSIGESPAFAAETIAAVHQVTGRAVPKLELAQCSLGLDPGALGLRYLDAARPSRQGYSRFIDKQPLNYLYLGLIRRALPRARYVAVVREPMDTCFALYKTLFAGAYPFSYDFVELAQYYRAWVALMRHWRDQLQDSLCVVRYEALIERPESVARGLLQHCDVEWEDACLTFQNEASAVTTASAAQVRRPLYASSVGKWRRYEHHLEPLSSALHGHDVTF